MRNRQATSLLVLVVIWVAVPHACGEIATARGSLALRGLHSLPAANHCSLQAKATCPASVAILAAAAVAQR